MSKKFVLIVLLAILAAFLTMAVIPPPEGANCSPGFWKQEQHFQYWNAGFAPGDMYNADMTYLDALQGGRNTIESRFIVAGLLNTAADPSVCPDEILE